jgi:hypothetical protein
LVAVGCCWLLFIHTDEQTWLSDSSTDPFIHTLGQSMAQVCKLSTLPVLKLLIHPCPEPHIFRWSVLLSVSVPRDAQTLGSTDHSAQKVSLVMEPDSPLQHSLWPAFLTPGS